MYAELPLAIASTSVRRESVLFESAREVPDSRTHISQFRLARYSILTDCINFAPVSPQHSTQTALVHHLRLWRSACAHKSVCSLYA